MIERIRRVEMVEPAPGTSKFEIAEVEPRGSGPMRIYDVWGYDAPPTLPQSVRSPYVPRSHFPPTGGVRVIVLTFPGNDPSRAAPGISDPEGARVDAMRNQQMQDAEPAGMTLYPGIPGMHRSDSIDVAVVVSGRIAIIASDGAQQILEPGDVYVQNGAPHSWENASDEPCTIAFFVVGADREASAD